MRSWGWMALALGGLLAIAQGTTRGDDVNVGDKAPVFESVDDQGKPWKSTDHVGKKTVVVFFYPAAMTGG